MFPPRPFSIAAEIIDLKGACETADPWDLPTINQGDQCNGSSPTDLYDFKTSLSFFKIKKAFLFQFVS